MDTAQLRLCLFDVLRNLATNGVNQFGGGLIREVAHNGGIREFMPKQERGRETLSGPDQEKVRELFWSLIIQGVVFPGINASNPQLPFFTLTEYGNQVVNSLDAVPHDPDRYLENLRNVAPSLSSAATSYISEGLECFQRGSYTASVVMLGVAAEKLTIDLASIVQQNLSASESKNLLKAIQYYGIVRVYDEMGKRLRPRIPLLPKELAGGLEGHLDGCFAIIRTHRNLASHPTGQKLDRLTAFGLFSVFPFYCKRACDLIDYVLINGLP